MSGQPVSSLRRPMLQLLAAAAALAVVVLLLLALASVFAHAQGLAVVQLSEPVEVLAGQEATVTAVLVSSGERVQAGQLLVRCDDKLQLAELARLSRLFRAGLLERLRDPESSEGAQQLRSLREQQELVEEALTDRALRAPAAGIVGEIKVGRGQDLVPGQVVLTLHSEASDPVVHSLFPGRYRQQLVPGLPLRLELRADAEVTSLRICSTADRELCEVVSPQTLMGAAGITLHLTIDAVADELVSPAAARSLLGPGSTDDELSAPLALVTSRLPVRTVRAGSNSIAITHGMRGLAEVQLDSR